MPISAKKVKTFASKVPWLNVVAKSGGVATKGDRLFPSKNTKNDRKFNFRIDKGSTDSNTGEVELILQANSNADDPEVKKAAQRDSHDILAKAKVDPKKPDATKAEEDLINSFRARS